MITLTILFLTLAAFVSGFIDAIAGGGGLIAVPALLAVGLPAQVALGTNKLQSSLGTAFGLANFARKKVVVWRVAAVGVPFALVGSFIGAKMAIFLPQALLAKIIVIALPPIALFVYFAKSAFKQCHPIDVTASASRSSPVSSAGLSLDKARDMLRRGLLAMTRNGATIFVCFVIGTYDGFLGPGTGTFLILALALFAHMPLVRASATAKTFNLASNVGAMVAFMIGGYVNYLYALPMAIGNIAGNLIGSHYAVKHGSSFVQKFLFVALAMLFVYLAWKYF